MDGCRFFLLQTPCMVSEIPSMMGRIVAYKLEPLRKTSSPASSPESSVSTSRKDVLLAATDNGLRLSLGMLFGIDSMTSGGPSTVASNSTRPGSRLAAAAGGLPPIIPSELADPIIEPSHKVRGSMQQTMRVEQEHIFTISYSLVKVAYHLSKWSRRVAAASIRVGPPTVAKPNELAFLVDMDDEGDQDSEDDEDEGSGSCREGDGDESDGDSDRDRTEQEMNAPYLTLDI
ncbi:hypothetical protein MFIFM68171_10204 [Madurella fahalii]|uniref:Uncharacterized protein n=1 Tax=Madurella fahalii TaxID=1157608 RepID=A0ABQ0GQG5_9PEZI